MIEDLMKYLMLVLTIFMHPVLLCSQELDNLILEDSTTISFEKNVDIDALLDEARALGVADEHIEIKPISYPEYLMRTIGGSILLKLLACKHYFERQWNCYITRSTDDESHEKKPFECA